MEHTPARPEVVTEVARVGLGETVADKYLLERVLGRGGMGIVFLARHLQLEGEVALKFLSPEFSTIPEAVGRFRREAQAAARLKSEHVVRVFDVGIHHNGLPYMVMEYLEGGDLGGLLKDAGRLSVELAADLLVQTCSAVAEAHRQGIIHRDLKPSNLFCVPRADGGLTIKVVDFGISKLTRGSASLEQGITVTGNIVGSPSYMSPEQMKTPNRIDQRTDIWSLGVVLYECLTGQLPFPATTYAEICLKVHQDPPLAASVHGVTLSKALEAIVRRCLAKEPEERYATAGELAQALAEFAPAPRPSWARAATAATVPEATSSVQGRPGPLPGSAKPARSTSTQPGWAHSAPPFGGRGRLPWILGASALALLGAVAWLLVPTKSAELEVASPAPVNAATVAGAASQVTTTPPWRPPTAEVPRAPDEAPTVAPLTTATVVAVPVSRPAPRAAASVASRVQAKPSPSAAATTASARKPAAERNSKSSVWAR